MTIVVQAITATICAASLHASAGTNPLIKERFTADLAPMVCNDSFVIAVYGTTK